MVGSFMRKKWKLSKWKITGLIFGILILLWFSVVVYNYYKPLSEGVNWVGDEYFVSENDIEFLYDLTYLDKQYM